MIELFSIATGVACGFLSSSPLGTINLWIVDRTLRDSTNPGEKSLRALKWFLLGVIAADLAYAAAAAWGYHTFLAETKLEKWVAGVGGIFLIILGLISLSRSGNEKAYFSLNQNSPIRELLLGAFMCGSNPGFFLFWIFAIDQIENHLGLILTGTAVPCFLAGIALGDLLWFSVLARIVCRFRSMVSKRVKNIINRSVGATFVMIGALGILKIV